MKFLRLSDLVSDRFRWWRPHGSGTRSYPEEPKGGGPEIPLGAQKLWRPSSSPHSLLPVLVLRRDLLLLYHENNMDQDLSIKGLFNSARSLSKQLETLPNPTASKYQETLHTAINQFEECRTLIDRLSLFSPNESFDDISSGDLQ